MISLTDVGIKISGESELAHEPAVYAVRTMD